MTHSRLICNMCSDVLTPAERDYYNEQKIAGPRFCFDCLRAAEIKVGRTECDELTEIEKNREQGNLFDGKQEAHGVQPSDANAARFEP